MVVLEIGGFGSWCLWSRYVVCSNLGRGGCNLFQFGFGSWWLLQWWICWILFRHGDLPLAMADLIVISNAGFGGCYERESVG